ncbi:type IV pilus twitching motility protein PilT [Calderihabitans maritimus]|uniref:Twitching motility protein PilT n=1 Tax=Calderihabitans maritimus TaxID=1246530 RepID=A0A1Z5HX67_9FIRM|nr:type IV pilus twitching motility protein PilT [Calderihabitans maritimus]GAW94129.1 twitching motility protein PilT [Calderihabitans maritimus]
MKIDEILRMAVDQKASDIHLTVGLPPVFRCNGDLIPQQSFDPLQYEDTLKMAREILSEKQHQEFMEKGELDLAYSLRGVGRFRVNVYRQRGSVGLAIRIINNQIKSLDELGLPPVLKELARKSKGLVLVTGPTGSGKSTTLAAMIDLINRERRCHIITLEDPIEYMHQHQKSIINQREIGSDTRSFADALRAALRQDPDVLLVGEMRDLETIATAITAAETGHLVLATLHTSSAPQTIDRIIDVFPPHQQQQVRIQLAETLQGVVAQQLVPRADGLGRVVAVEVLVATPAVRNLIREGKTHQILSAIQTGGKYGMQSMDSALKKLYQQGLITAEDMMARLSDRDIKPAYREF